MMSTTNGQLSITRNGRTVQLQALNDATYFNALRTMGIGEAVAQGLTAGLITIKKGNPS